MPVFPRKQDSSALQDRHSDEPDRHRIRVSPGRRGFPCHGEVSSGARCRLNDNGVDVSCVAGSIIAWTANLAGVPTSQCGSLPAGGASRCPKRCNRLISLLAKAEVGSSTQHLDTDWRLHSAKIPVVARGGWHRETPQHSPELRQGSPSVPSFQS